MTEIKTRKPMTKLYKALEVEYGCELRLSLERFHPEGKYNGITRSVKMRAEVAEGVNQDRAYLELKKDLDQKLREAIDEGIQEFVQLIEGQK